MGFYQRYEDQKFEARRILSADIDPKPGEVAKFPPGIVPADLTRPEDSSRQIENDTFAALEGGNTDIATLTAANQNYKAKFEAEPEMSLADASQELGPAKVAGDTQFGPPMPGLDGAQTPVTDQIVESNPNVPELPVVNNVAETGGVNDENELQPVLVQTGSGQYSPIRTTTVQQAPAIPAGPVRNRTEYAQQSISPRTRSGIKEINSVLAGIAQCAEDIVVELWEFIKEATALLKDGALGVEYEYGRGWFGTEEDWLRFKGKIQAIRDELANSGQAFVEFMAALDHHYPQVKYWNSVLNALIRSLRWFYTETEWVTLAAEGSANAEKIVNEAKAHWEKDSYYAGAYIVCTIGSMFSPRALVKLLKAARNLGKTIDALDGPDVPDHPKPAPKAPDEIIDDPNSSGQQTPLTSPQRWQDREGNVEPAPGVPGRVRGPSDQELLDHPKTIPIDDLTEFVRNRQVANILAKHGYDVDIIDDPRLPKDVPVMKSTDPFYDGGKNVRRPDYRINGVLFDRKEVKSTKGMFTQINKSMRSTKENGPQSRNFVIQVPPGKVKEFMDELERRMSKPLQASDPKNDLRQVIITDGASGQLMVWRK